MRCKSLVNLNAAIKSPRISKKSSKPFFPSTVDSLNSPSSSKRKSKTTNLISPHRTSTPLLHFPIHKPSHPTTTISKHNTQATNTTTNIYPRNTPTQHPIPEIAPKQREQRTNLLLLGHPAAQTPKSQTHNLQYISPAFPRAR